MSRIDSYKHLDIDDPWPLKVTLQTEELAKVYVGKDHGVHRLLSALVHSLRNKWGHDNVLAGELERLLNEGLDDGSEPGRVDGQIRLTCNQMMVLLDIYRGTFRRERHLMTVEKDIQTLLKVNLIERVDGKVDEWNTTDGGGKLVRERLGAV